MEELRNNGDQLESKITTWSRRIFFSTGGDIIVANTVMRTGAIRNLMSY
jgi:hypothetical protein